MLSVRWVLLRGWVVWVRRVGGPDSYRIPHENLGRWFADQVAAQIHDLERHGNGLAAFIVEVTGRKTEDCSADDFRSVLQALETGEMPQAVSA